MLERVKEESRKRGEPFKKTLNDLLRLAVSIEKASLPVKPFKVRPFQNTGYNPGFNFDCIGELLDQLEGPFRR